MERNPRSQHPWPAAVNRMHFFEQRSLVGFDIGCPILPRVFAWRAVLLLLCCLVAFHGGVLRVRRVSTQGTDCCTESVCQCRSAGSCCSSDAPREEAPSSCCDTPTSKPARPVTAVVTSGCPCDHDGPSVAAARLVLGCPEVFAWVPGSPPPSPAREVEPLPSGRPPLGPEPPPPRSAERLLRQPS